MRKCRHWHTVGLEAAEIHTVTQQSDNNQALGSSSGLTVCVLLDEFQPE